MKGEEGFSELVARMRREGWKSIGPATHPTGAGRPLVARKREAHCEAEELLAELVIPFQLTGNSIADELAEAGAARNQLSGQEVADGSSGAAAGQHAVVRLARRPARGVKAGPCYRP